MSEYWYSLVSSVKSNMLDIENNIMNIGSGDILITVAKT